MIEAWFPKEIKRIIGSCSYALESRVGLTMFVRAARMLRACRYCAHYRSHVQSAMQAHAQAPAGAAGGVGLSYDVDFTVDVILYSNLLATCCCRRLNSACDAAVVSSRADQICQKVGCAQACRGAGGAAPPPPHKPGDACPPHLKPFYRQ
jgi:hypothetical protein